MNIQENKRKELRFLLNTELNITVAGKNAVHGECKNISSSGFLILANEAIDVGLPVKVERHKGKVEFAADAKTIRCEKSDNGYLIGLEISEFID